MAADPSTGAFGRKLREARERRGISLRQIANATKISIGALEALERNHISRLPGGIFSRAFVRSYAIEVGLDPEETIQEFIAQFPNDSVTAGHPTSAEHGEDNQALESHRRMASAFLRLIVVSLPIVGLVVYYTARGGSRSTPPPEPPAAARSEPPPAPDLTASAPPTSGLADDPSAVPASAADPLASSPAAAKSVPELLKVGVAATAPCWVSAVVDGQTAIQRELLAGERQTLEVHRELVLTAGDAAALTLTLNGQDARPLGKPGEVVTTRFSPANFKEYLVSR